MHCHTVTDDNDYDKIDDNNDDDDCDVRIVTPSLMTVTMTRLTTVMTMTCKSRCHR